MNGCMDTLPKHFLKTISLMEQLIKKERAVDMFSTKLQAATHIYDVVAFDLRQ